MKRTVRAGPNDGLCRPGCKVIEWESCGNGDRKTIIRGTLNKKQAEKARTLLSSQVVPFREFQD